MQWDANTEPDLAGYRLYQGFTSRSYTTTIDVGNVVTWTLRNLLDRRNYCFAVTARDTLGNESGYSNEVCVITGDGTPAETISAPSIPSGPTSGVTGVAHTYTTSGAVSSSGDSVQYRFSWADGTDSGWLPVGTRSATKTWSLSGTYNLVRAEARCAVHTTIVSPTSPAITVSIAAAPSETVSAPAAPSGPSNGAAGVAYTYTTGGAISSTGDPVQYRFSWADGTTSAWLPAASAAASKTWNATGIYTPVRAEARCALHQTILSPPSRSITVTIAAGSVETVSRPSAPAGTATGTTNLTYVFSTGSAVSSNGDPVRYRFSWGDGTVSEWINAGQQVTASKSWSVPGSYFVQAEASCATHPTVGAFSTSTVVSIAPNTAYVLWSRNDKGMAALWEIDAASNAWRRSVWLHSSSGIGAPWQAADYARIDNTSGYVLWTRGDTGQAALWKVDPATGRLLSSFYLYPPSGVGGPWQASSYAHVNATTGYVLWTRGDTGQAALWKINPGATPSDGVIPIVSSTYLHSPSGVGGPWQASGYSHVDATTGYVLWTRSDTGQAAIWKINPGATPSDGVIPIVESSYIYSASGVGGPWQATGYVR